jgi:hypothetical protein
MVIVVCVIAALCGLGLLGVLFGVFDGTVPSRPPTHAEHQIAFDLARCAEHLRHHVDTITAADQLRSLRAVSRERSGQTQRPDWPTATRRR